MNAEAVGSLLRAARRRAGLRLEDVARRLECSIPYLSDVERGKRSITTARLRKLARLVGMTKPELQTLFVHAERLPPAVAKRLLKSPEAWDVDVPRLLKAIAAAPPEVRAALAAALAPSPW